jgi:DNA primase
MRLISTAVFCRNYGRCDEIKAQLDLVDYISQTVKLRRTGKKLYWFLPLSQQHAHAFFVVFPETQTWRCFGQCNEGGDLFGFVMKKEGWDFNETLRILAEKAGVTLSSQPESAKLMSRHAAASSRCWTTLRSFTAPSLLKLKLEQQRWLICGAEG